MKTVFIINPCAGCGKNTEALICNIKSASQSADADVEIYITKSPGDATSYIRDFCNKYGSARFIACGGDGTLSEVVNGVIGFEGCQVGVLPIGTGNDFCRNFKSDTNFENITLLLQGDTVKCDAIKYTTCIDGIKKSGYCANMFNIGFDCNVADMTAEMKKKPFISGSLAYLISVFAMLIRKKGASLKIELDGKETHNGRLLLTSIANGSYCGGGFKSNPLASLKDGLININIVKNISRLRFLTLLPCYMKGTFLEVRGIDKIISSLKCKKIVVTPLSGKMRLCSDGEIIDAGRTEFEIVPQAFEFVVPGVKVLQHIMINNNLNIIITTKQKSCKAD